MNTVGFDVGSDERGTDSQQRYAPGDCRWIPCRFYRTIPDPKKIRKKKKIGIREKEKINVLVAM